MLCFLILVPVVFSLFTFLFTKTNDGAKSMALISSILTMGLGGYVSAQTYAAPLVLDMPWIPSLGVRFNLVADGMSGMLVLLTAIVYLVVMIAWTNKEMESPASFFGLMLLAQAGLMGVFLANDAFLFYTFWELALIPVYFLCSLWGGEKRIQVTMKFFLYTFVGSLMLLGGLVYLAMQVPAGDNYSLNNLIAAGSKLPNGTQLWLFWLMFIAFAVKMPIFPFHTWQPDTYEQSPTPVTIVLSALMVKMGVFAVLKWLLPVVPVGVAYWSNTVVILSVIGIVYASCLAIVQTDIKRLVAYSSIAHIGLMSAVAFSHNTVGMHGILVQMFNHGINITGMWLMVSMIENRYGTRDMTKLGGMASSAPVMAISLVIVSFAGIALPLTNGFVGEFMLFNGLFGAQIPNAMVMMIIAGLGVILGAVYTLNMIQKTAYGEAKSMIIAKDISVNEMIGMAIVISIILFLGFYPKPLTDMTLQVAGALVR